MARPPIDVLRSDSFASPTTGPDRPNEGAPLPHGCTIICPSCSSAAVAGAATAGGGSKRAPDDSSIAVFEEVVGVESLFGRDPRAMFEISNASSEEEMHALVARTMFAECPALTSVVTMLRRSPDERLVLRSHYNEGVWDPYHVGFQPPDVSHALGDLVLTAKKPIIRSVDPETFTVEWWFREPYYCIVPIFSVDATYVEGCLVFGSKKEIPDVRGLIAYAQVACGAISFAWERIGRLEDAVRIGQKIEREHVLQTVHDSAVQDVFAAEMALGDVLGEGGLSASCEAGMRKALDYVRQANHSLRAVLASDDPLPSQNESFLRDLLEAETSRYLSDGGVPVDAVIDERCMLPRS